MCAQCWLATATVSQGWKYFIPKSYVFNVYLTIIYITKIMEYVCPAMRFAMLWGMGLKLGMGIEDGPPRLKSIFSKWPHRRSKVIQRSSYLRNALWLPNLVGRVPDQRVMHCGVKGHAGVIQGQPGVKLLRNALWPPNLVGKISDQTVMQCWSQRSCRGQLGSSRGQLA